MSLSATPVRTGRPEPSLQPVVGARRLDRRTEAEHLRMEVMAAGQDMQSIADRIYAALIDGDLRRVEHHAGRLAALGGEYAKGGI